MGERQPGPARGPRPLRDRGDAPARHDGGAAFPGRSRHADAPGRADVRGGDPTCLLAERATGRVRGRLRREAPREATPGLRVPTKTALRPVVPPGRCVWLPCARFRSLLPATPRDRAVACTP